MTPHRAQLSPTVFLVDDDADVRQGLSLLITTIGLAVESFPDPLQFLQQLDASRIGAILLDLRMPGLSGMAVLEELAARRVDLPVILLTGHGTIDSCRQAFKTGACDFLEKPVDDQKLLDSLQNAVRQHITLRAREAIQSDARRRYQMLSDRERDVLALMVAGLTNKEIGRQLTVSHRTVETHRAHLFEKLEVDSLAQLIRCYAGLTEETMQGGSVNSLT